MKRYEKIIKSCRECPNCYYYDVTDEEIKPLWICKKTFEHLDDELEGFGEECPLEDVAKDYGWTDIKNIKQHSEWHN